MDNYKNMYIHMRFDFNLYMKNHLLCSHIGVIYNYLIAIYIYLIRFILPKSITPITLYNIHLCYNIQIYNYVGDVW